MKFTRKTILYFSAFLLLLSTSCTTTTSENSVSLTVEPSISSDLIDVVVTIDDEEIIKKIADLTEANLVVGADNVNVPYQLVKNSDGKLKQLLVLLNFTEGKPVAVSITTEEGVSTEFEKRTYAEIAVGEGGEWKEVVKKNGNEQYEYQGGVFKNVDFLKVPEQHTDHSFYIKYEGPGWESDKVGYRFYLDWRNAVDIFAKKVNSIVLPQVGQDGFDSYHEENDWGMDVLKVGSSLGIGSLGFWDGENANRVATTDSVTSKVIMNGVIRSGIKTYYYGWSDAGTKTTLKSKITIDAGSRLTHQKVYLSDSLSNICTGIVKHAEGELLTSSDESSEWNYIATFGKQSLNDDMLGMVVFYRSQDALGVTEDAYSHVVVLQPENNFVEYYFGATWELDTDNIATKEAFTAYLNDELEKLNNSIQVK